MWWLGPGPNRAIPAPCADRLVAPRVGGGHIYSTTPAPAHGGGHRYSPAWHSPTPTLHVWEGMQTWQRQDARARLHSLERTEPGHGCWGAGGRGGERALLASAVGINAAPTLGSRCRGPLGAAAAACDPGARHAAPYSCHQAPPISWHTGQLPG